MFRLPPGVPFPPDGTLSRNREVEISKPVCTVAKQTERGWEHAEDMSTLLPSLVRYGDVGSPVGSRLQEKLRNIPPSRPAKRRAESPHTLRARGA